MSANAHDVDRAGDEWWRDLAACRGQYDLFFSEVFADQLEARKVCAGCPVLAECGDWVRRYPQHHGVWAGTIAVGKRRRRRFQNGVHRG